MLVLMPCVWLAYVRMCAGTQFAIVAMVLGSALFAYVVGAISTVFTTGTVQDQRFQMRMAQLHDYLEIRRIPADIARIIRVQCMHKWKRTGATCTCSRACKLPWKLALLV